MAFQSSLFSGVGVVEVAVGTIAAAVLIWGNIEPSHFSFLHVGQREESDAESSAGFLLSLETHEPARLPWWSGLLYPGNNTQKTSVSFSQSTKIIKTEQNENPNKKQENNFN